MKAKKTIDVLLTEQLSTEEYNRDIFKRFQPVSSEVLRVGL